MALHSCGFEIHREGEALVCTRRPRGRALVLLIAGGLFLIAAINAAVQFALAHTSAAAILTGVAVLALAGTLAALAAHRRALRAPPPVTLRIELNSGEIFDGDGQRLCRREQLTWSERFDPFDSTQGFMYFLVASWPGGQARVYKAGGCSRPPAELVRAREYLQQARD